jgi:hypothetical protein
VDLAPLIIDLPPALFAAGYEINLRLNGAPRLDVVGSPSPHADRLAHLKDKHLIKLKQLIDLQPKFAVQGSLPTPIQLKQSGRRELLMKTVAGNDLWLTLEIREPGTMNYVAADSVKLTFKRTQDLYTLWSVRDDAGANSWTLPDYPLDPGNTQAMDLYPEAYHLDSGLPDPAKTQYLLHVHGYNITEAKSYEEIGEQFRRTYWTGFRGQFVGLAWNGDETHIDLLDFTPSFGENVENAFQSAYRLYQFIEDKIHGEWGIPAARLDVTAHSLGNQLLYEALRLQQVYQPGVKFVNTVTSIEPAVWTETFWETAPYTLTLLFAKTYSIEDLKQNSWAFWFNQPGREVKNAWNKLIHSFIHNDYAVKAMRLDDCLKRNPHSNQFYRIDLHRPAGVPIATGDPIINDRVAVHSGANQVDLARQTPVLLLPDQNFPNTFPGLYPPVANNCVFWDFGPWTNQVVPPLAHSDDHRAAEIKINALDYGWLDKAHGSGFKGFDEGEGESPLPRTWKWYMEILKELAYEIRKE